MGYKLFTMLDHLKSASKELKAILDDKTYYRDEILKLISESHHLVFNKAIEFQSKENLLDTKLDYDSPFKSFTIEIANSHIYEIEAEGIRIPPQLKYSPEDLVRNTCLFVFENDLGSWNIAKLMELTNKTTTAVWMTYTNHKDLNDVYGDVMQKVVQSYINLINSPKVSFGVEPINHKFKFGSKSDRQFCKIKEIIHIRQNHPINPALEIINNKTIEFTHRFWKRGHWRSIGVESIGKNRQGEYCVTGKTWVTEHIVGDTTLPLIKKDYLTII